jgi:hypothetical protein
MILMKYGLILFGFILFPLFIIKYNKYLIKHHKMNYSCHDKLNKKLFKLNKFTGCYWNLSHIIIYCLACLVINAELDYKKHLIVFMIGLFWYLFSPYKDTTKKPKKCKNMVYRDTNQPREDDIIFNVSGQVLYVVLYLIYQKIR